MVDYSYTTNGALQFQNSGKKIVDFFAAAAAMRGETDSEQGVENLMRLFYDAFTEDPQVAIKLGLGWLGDPRSGAGEKRGRQIIAQTLAVTGNQDFLIDNLDKIVEYGYWKDLIVLHTASPELKEHIISFWAQKLTADTPDRLAGKWAPRLKSSQHNFAVDLKNKMGLTNAAYRKKIKNTSATVEQLMCANKFDSIDYGSVPSVAMRKYSKKAFPDHDGERFENFLNDDGTEVKASVLYPHDILKEAVSGNVTYANKAWENLPNYLQEGENILPMCDVSGSMTISMMTSHLTPLDISIALGMYLSERASGLFKNKVMTFSSSPDIVSLRGETLRERMNCLSNIDWGMSTNLSAACRELLYVANKAQLPPKDMPTMLLILSDMQFDEATDDTTLLTDIKSQYEADGYIMPKIVFWNLFDKKTGSPAQANENNVALVSGFSPSLMTAILGGEDFSPLAVALRAADAYAFNFTKLNTVPDRKYQPEY